MFGKLKQAAMRKIVQSQMKDVPQDQQDMIMGMMEKNPELLTKVAKEMQAEMKINGNNQMAAAMKVLPKYQKELQEAMGPDMVRKITEMQAGGAGKFKPDGRPF